MQKVAGSSPVIRFRRARNNAGLQARRVRSQLRFSQVSPESGQGQRVRGSRPLSCTEVLKERGHREVNSSSTSWGSLVRAQYRPLKNPRLNGLFVVFIGITAGSQCLSSACDRVRGEGSAFTSLRSGSGAGRHSVAAVFDARARLGTALGSRRSCLSNNSDAPSGATCRVSVLCLSRMLRS